MSIGYELSRFRKGDAWRYEQMFASWVHNSTGDDVVLRARQQSLIASHILAGALACLVFAVYFTVTGALTVLAVAVSLWFLTPVAIACFLSRTGRLATAHLMSSASFLGLICIAAAYTGGLSSFVIAWIPLVALEAALSADRRVMATATVLAAAALLALYGVAELGYLPGPLLTPLAADRLALISHLAAATYAGGLAAAIQLIHRKSEAEIHSSREHYRLIAENTSDLITRHDADGLVTFASPVSRQLLGVPASALLSDGLHEQVSADGRAIYLAAIKRCLVEGVPVCEEFALLRAGPGGPAQKVWVEMRCQPIRGCSHSDGADEKIEGLVAVTRDITLRRAHELEVSAARDAAERASRAKTQFLAHVSHELRTPLSAIIGFSEFMHRQLLLRDRDAKHADYCRIIHESGEHLLCIVNDLLDVSKIESGSVVVDPEPLRVSAIARHCSETVSQLAAKKSITINVAIPDDLPQAFADKRAFRQVLLNLLANAIKFTGEGGSIDLSARGTAGAIEIAVRDTGIGIAKDHLPKLCEPFYQAETSYGRTHDGTGLGLAIVKGLVALHGGKLRIDSQLGIGTTVTVSFPFMQNPLSRVDGTRQTPTSQDTVEPQQQPAAGFRALSASNSKPVHSNADVFVVNS